jgi:hypothetical protein
MSPIDAFIDHRHDDAPVALRGVPRLLARRLDSSQKG